MILSYVRSYRIVLDMNDNFVFWAVDLLVCFVHPLMENGKEWYKCEVHYRVLQLRWVFNYCVIELVSRTTYYMS